LHRFLLDVLLGNFCNQRWYRRWQGGHWEQWIIDAPVADTLWLDYLACTRDTGGRPPGGRGTPTCETWP
jgi:hypothetical protein